MDDRTLRLIIFRGETWCESSRTRWLRRVDHCPSPDWLVFRPRIKWEQQQRLENCGL